jgi:hypothetical protein
MEDGHQPATGGRPSHQQPAPIPVPTAGRRLPTARSLPRSWRRAWPARASALSGSIRSPPPSPSPPFPVRPPIARRQALSHRCGSGGQMKVETTRPRHPRARGAKRNATRGSMPERWRDTCDAETAVFFRCLVWQRCSGSNPSVPAAAFGLLRDRMTNHRATSPSQNKKTRRDGRVFVIVFRRKRLRQLLPARTLRCRPRPWRRASAPCSG